MGSHRGLSATLPFWLWQLTVGIDLVFEARHEATPRRTGDLTPVVPSRPRETADAGHLTADEGIARRHDYAEPAGKRGGAEAGEIRRRRSGTASVK
jgi:hypothetical protein